MDKRLAALVLLTVPAVGACSSGAAGNASTSAPARGTSAAPATSTGGTAAQMRFVVVTPPGTAPVDVVSGDPGSGSKVVSGLQPGTVTDYLAVPTGGQSFLVAGGTTLTTLTYPHPGNRETVAIGLDSNGSATSTEFEEQGGKVVAVQGDIGTDSPDVPPGKALLLGSGLGNGSLSAMADGGDGFLLGPPEGGCLDGPGQSGDSKSVVGTQADFYADAGPVELVWFGDTSCATPLSLPVHTTLAAGQQAYAFTWFADAGHLHLLYVPVPASGSGKAGVIDSGDGPAFPSAGSPGDSAVPTDSASPSN